MGLITGDNDAERLEIGSASQEIRNDSDAYKKRGIYCDCLTWARTDGRLTNHHPQCPSFKEVNFAKIKNLESQCFYIHPVNKLNDAFDGEFDGAEIGSKWEVELVKMTQEEFEALPEFQGH